VPTILGELKRYFRDLGWSVHVPRGAQEQALKVQEAQERLTSRSGRPPTETTMISVAARQLTPRERRRLALRFAGDMTQTQIAQEIGVSQMQVSRILRRAQTQLRELTQVDDRRSLRPQPRPARGANRAPCGASHAYAEAVHVRFSCHPAQPIRPA
jgi:RNA polymerase sigma-B factor